ncbi:MAG TPA: TIGR01777 family oxidoreductase [Bryobacteraceae bacterium]|nr:TIGR01777 family oxidoreductase [Bryobacteraceae bacterium]
MNVTLTGASGFLGHLVVEKLLAAGHQVQALGRKRAANIPAQVAFSQWDALAEPPAASLAGAGAVIHLAGEPVAQRWTPAAKARIRSSRVDSTRRIVDALSKEPQRPRVLVCASAIGFYGPRGDEALTETSAPSGSDFLARLAIEWEGAAGLAEALGIRVVQLRLGVVLGRGGALAKMLPPFRFGAGGRLGSGRQWMSWIHIQDAVRLVLFAMENASLRGPVNATAPNPVTNAEFTRQLASALHRPALFPVPGFALRLLLGEMSQILLTGQRVLPKAAEAAGFEFQYPELRTALASILSGAP